MNYGNMRYKDIISTKCNRNSLIFSGVSVCELVQGLGIEVMSCMHCGTDVIMSDQAPSSLYLLHKHWI